MTTPHTPGPWIFAYGAVYQGDDPNTVEENAGRIALADRENPHTTPCERDANCRLIAAAPEMLQSLQSLFEHCAMIHNRGGEWCNQREADAAVKAARAAIKKATGEP